MEEKTEVKGQLVAPGFEDCSRDEVRKDSLPCGKENFALTASYTKRINTTDIKLAFIQGISMRRDVLLEPPHKEQHF